MKLPHPRGPVSERLIAALRRPPHALQAPAHPRTPPPPAGDTLHDEDVQLALFVCYELHYRGFAGVSDRWEWQPGLLAFRAVLEEAFERDLRAAAGEVEGTGSVERDLIALVAADDGPPLSRFIERDATLERFREFVMHRSVYHLKEADPHTWAIPRLDGPAKAALIEIQIDEYGGGRLPRMHAELFRTTMAGLDLDTSYGAYVDAVPAITLATGNLISLFGLHRRLRGALLGHLAAFEMSSSLPNRRYGNGLRRLGGTPEITRFYDEHVEADAVHEQIAAHDMCGGFCALEQSGPAPRRNVAASAVLFGAAAALAVDRLFAAHLLDHWHAGETSLRTETVPTPALAA
jgi:hypothetical protein